MVGRQTRSDDQRAAVVAVVAVFLAALALFAYTYVVHVDRPGVTRADGWYGYYDQGHYLDEAHALADGHLPARPADYLYGLGYPVLGVPMIAVGLDGDPFSVPDALLFAAAMAMIVVLGTRLHSVVFGVVGAAAVALATPLLSLMVVPWSTSVTVVAVLGALVLATEPHPLRARQGVLLGLLVGWCFAARFVDAAYPAVVGVVALARHRPVPRGAITAAVAAAAVVGALVLWSQDRVFGDPFTTPYVGHILDGRTDQDVGAYRLSRIPRSFLEVVVTGNDHGRREPADPLLVRFPWVVAAPLGLLVLVRRRHRLAAPIVVATAASVASALFYLSFRFGTGANLKFGNLRFFAASFPLWGLLAVYALATVLSGHPRRAIATMGWLRRMPPVEPRKGASPKEKMPPSVATIQ